MTREGRGRLRAALAAARAFVEAERQVFVECHTVAGDLADLSPSERRWLQRIEKLRRQIDHAWSLVPK